MSGVGRRRVQHDLGVTGQFQAAGAVAEIAQGGAPQFEIAAARNANLQLSFDAQIPPRQFDQPDAESVAEGIGCFRRRLSQRPKFAAVQIAHVEEKSVAVLGGISIPAG